MKNKLFLLLLTVLIISCSKTEPRKPIVRKTSSFMRESIERNKVLNKLEEGLIMQKMQSDSLHTYNTSPNGFWYFYEEKDTIKSVYPVKGDEVIFTYEIKDLRDSIIYTKEELGEKQYLVDREELISGLQDGIKLMKEGETITFLFPSYKAYGFSGFEKINSNQPLIYSVHLKKIISK